MRILVVGAESEYAIERPYIKYLSQIPSVDRVDFFRAQNRFLEYYNRGIVHKVAYRFGFSSVLREINAELVETIKKARPDVVFVFKGMEIFPETLTWIRTEGIKLVNYNPDNPFIFSGRGSGNKNITRSIGLYHLHFTYDYEVKNRLEREYGIPAVILPFGFDLSQELFNACEAQEEVMRLCFLGNPDKYRASFLNKLVERNLLIDVYGQEWRKYVHSKSIKIHDAVYGDLFWKTLRKYRVQLNLMRPHNPKSHNMRTFEIAGVGGIQLAPDTLDHRTYFTPDKEILLYTTPAECADRIVQAHFLTKDSAILIRNAARERSLISAYSYQDRAHQVFEVLSKLLNG